MGYKKKEGNQKKEKKGDSYEKEENTRT